MYINSRPKIIVQKRQVNNVSHNGQHRLSFKIWEFVTGTMRKSSNPWSAFPPPTGGGGPGAMMQDELISHGFSPLAWTQDRVPLCELEHGFISRIPPDEDEEPNFYDDSVSETQSKLYESALEATLDIRRAMAYHEHTEAQSSSNDC
ncbi:hypothetical protein P3342_009056 [Pyrenophora teres f. teres]|uniref:Uncharacterized protein n=1 Tax=Pyrenophora teres f. teres TaxID=97479 RepID=A0A6S6W786_9PLEO|nr:hypothetical protein HRS9139_07729 [Pyrenophora teres f. teres]KAE8831111.1 hypothetical protein PTNB85_07698 [Pyrenophora teres f. teres]KAE8856889.1 hypothetical protein PTNB29_07956 [Pyrenophora teres f. teres]KAE8863758.1 hypothetical protein PTNB73_06965 [Pyrenophora teres f. teres]KAK1919332.1 hypothetical protein P3342_009056 [Pyrenophora teres f. teres]